MPTELPPSRRRSRSWKERLLTVALGFSVAVILLIAYSIMYDATRR